jgi:hypothetical protein
MRSNARGTTNRQLPLGRLRDAELDGRIATLLHDASMKRKAAREAHDACDDDAKRRLIGEAEVREGAANDLDPAHTHQSWHTEL